MSELQLEAAPYPKVTKEDIENRIVHVSYSSPDARKSNTNPLGMSTVTICNIELDNGFSVRGESACVDRRNFDAQKGRLYAYEDAFLKLWEPLGFLLAEDIFRAKCNTPKEQRKTYNAGSVTIDYIERVARMGHMINRAYCAALGDLSHPVWEEAEQWQKDSSIAAVKAQLEGDLSPERTHESWYEHKLQDGWIYGPVKDPIKKEHPCMVAYADLPVEQRVKDHLFRAVVKSYI